VHVPFGRRSEVRAIYRVPTVNLDTAAAETRRGARAKWGAVLNGLPHPIQVVIRGRPAATLPVVERIKVHGSAPARELAAWLGAHLHGGDLVERERYLVVPAEDLETLSDRCASLEASLRRIGLPLERIQATDEPRGVLSGFLTPRPRQFGPAVVDISASGHLVADGEHVRAFDLGKLPPTIITDWASPLLDGDLPLDVSIDIEPLDLAWAKLQLDTRRWYAGQTGPRSSGVPNASASALKISAQSCDSCAGNSVSAGLPCCQCVDGHWRAEACLSKQGRWPGRIRSRPARWPSRAGCRSA
jgi:hypothetical protein